MIDSLSDGFMSIDKTWRFVYLNDTAERYLQQEREYLLGRELWECYPELAESGYGEIYRQTAATGEARTHTAYYAPLGAWFEARSFAHDDGITVLFRDVTRDHEYAAQLQFEASHDYLTGLPNRRSCVEVLTAAVADAGDAAAGEAGLAVLLIDVDHFKDVNDAFGHALGDDLLCAVAERLRALAAPAVFTARMEGDNFVMLLPGAGLDAAAAFAQAVLGAFASPFDAGGRPVALSASIGIAPLLASTVSAQSPQSAETLLSQADTAMYAAKAAGRARVRVFDDVLDRGLRDRLAMRMGFRAAFAENQFELHFQPQIRLGGGGVGAAAGAEALLRWRHPVYGLLTPAAFLDVLLESSFENPLVDWLLAAVCRQIGAWRRQGVPVPRISFNVSARQLLSPGLADKVLRIAGEHDVAPALLDIEVTEDSLVSDVEKAIAVLATLKRAGMSTSLDDFGSGYSSLGYLVRLPIDTLKIDKSFVHALLDSDKAAAVIRGIVGLARSLGMQTVAEGVESQGQADLLKESGCDVIQGYLISRPLAPEAFAQFMLRS